MTGYTKYHVMVFKCNFCPKEIVGRRNTIEHLVKEHPKEVLLKMFEDNELHEPYMENYFMNFGKEALRVLKPGAFLLMFGGTRTYHRLVCGIEDAGFEIRDTIMWLYGSGFPKSLNIGKQIDKIQGNERKVVGEKIRGDVEKAKKGITFAGADANKNTNPKTLSL